MDKISTLDIAATVVTPGLSSEQMDAAIQSLVQQGPSAKP